MERRIRAREKKARFKRRCFVSKRTIAIVTWLIKKSAVRLKAFKTRMGKGLPAKGRGSRTLASANGPKEVNEGDKKKASEWRTAPEMVRSSLGDEKGERLRLLRGGKGEGNVVGVSMRRTRRTISLGAFTKVRKEKKTSYRCIRSDRKQGSLACERLAKQTKKREEDERGEGGKAEPCSGCIFMS